MNRSIIIMTLSIVSAAAVVIAAVGSAGAQGTPGYGTNVFAGLKTDASEYAVGEPVKINFIVQNRTDKPVTYQFSSGKKYDIFVYKNNTEVWQWSRGKMFTQALTSITIPAKGQRTFTEVWPQVDNKGNRVGPGSYVIRGQITPMSVPASCTPGASTIACVQTNITIGANPKVVPTTVSAIVKSKATFEGKLVSLDGTYRGWRADGESSACKAGPPVSRTDWAVADPTGCIYVTGRSGLDPQDDYGKRVTVMGRVRLTQAGQPYIEARSVKVVPASK